MTWKTISIETDLEENYPVDLICQNPYQSHQPISTIIKETKYINAYDTEWHVHQLWGVDSRATSPKYDPQEMRTANIEEAKDFLYSVKDQDWYREAFHPLLTRYSFDVVENPKISDARWVAPLQRLSHDLNGFSFAYKPELKYSTLFNPEGEKVIHAVSCYKCKGKNQECMCGRRAPCYYTIDRKQNALGLHLRPCRSGLFSQGGRTINLYKPGGKIEVGLNSNFTRNKVTLLHELAHVVTPNAGGQAAGHGPEFLGALGYIFKMTLGDETYEAFRQGTRDQAKPRSLLAFNSNFADSQPEFAQHIIDDTPVKGQKRILTPYRQELIQQNREDRIRQKEWKKLREEDEKKGIFWY